MSDSSVVTWSEASDCPTLVSVTQAAHLTGVGERRIRRWIAAGRLPAVTSQQGKLVDVGTVRQLASDTVRPAVGQSDTHNSPRQTASDSVSDGLTELVALLRERDELLREQQRTIMELSGRVGFLQAENLHLKEQVVLLSAPPSEPTSQVISEIDNHPTAPENGAVRGAEKGARPWWAFWRRPET